MKSVTEARVDYLRGRTCFIGFLMMKKVLIVVCVCLCLLELAAGGDKKDGARERRKNGRRKNKGK